MHWGSLDSMVDGEEGCFRKMGPLLPSDLMLHHTPGIWVRNASAGVVSPKFSTVVPTPCTQGPDAFHFVTEIFKGFGIVC